MYIESDKGEFFETEVVIMETNYIPTKSIVETMTEARENLKKREETFRANLKTLNQDKDSKEDK